MCTAEGRCLSDQVVCWSCLVGERELSLYLLKFILSPARMFVSLFYMCDKLVCENLMKYKQYLLKSQQVKHKKSAVCSVSYLIYFRPLLMHTLADRKC